jgi:hypothetical protein
VGAPVASLFRAMKTLRETDSERNPRDFVKKWGPDKDGIGAVIDISHDPPAYDEMGLEMYYKCPTAGLLQRKTRRRRVCIRLII